MIRFEQKGNFNKIETFLNRMSKFRIEKILRRYGQEGVAALASATPTLTGATAGAWDFTVNVSQTSATLEWTNSEMAGGTPLVILLQYGHGTGTGGYVRGIDFINPAVRPVFEKIVEGAWKEVTSA